MFVFILTFIVASLGAAIAAWYINKHKYDKQLGNLKSPVAFPLIGSALEFTGSHTIIPKLLKYQEKFKGSFKLILGFDFYVVVNDYDRMEFILGTTKLLKKSKNYNFFRKWLGNGLLTSTGEQWKQQRRILTPTFHFQILEQFLEVFHTCSTVFVEKLAGQVGKSSVDIYPFVTNCALDIICESAMGTSVNAQENPDTDYIISVKKMCKIMIDRSFSPIQQFDFLYQFTENYRTEQKCVKILHDYTKSVIKQRREGLIHKQTTGEKEGTDDLGRKKRQAFLDVLLQANINGKPLTDEEIRQEVDTFMFEGHDTTASAISFTLYCLAQYPEIQAKVVEELTDIFGNDKTRPATYQELQDMKYLDKVIKETLRLYPSVPAFAREVENEFELDGAKYPPGLTLLMFPIGLQRDAKYFPDPEKFDPERFSTENQLEKLPYSYVPFSAGPRNCIGQKFAMLEIKSTVSKVIRNYELMPSTPKHELNLIFETILKSSTGMKIQLKKR